jgi:hypothetical protein
LNKRKREIVRAILKTLDALEGVPAYEDMIVDAVAVVLPVKPTQAEFDEALKHCDSKRWIAGLPSHITEKLKWTITDKGQAAMLEL